MRGSTKGRDQVGNSGVANFRMYVTGSFLCNCPGLPCKMSASSLLSENEYREREDEGEAMNASRFTSSFHNNDERKYCRSKNRCNSDKIARVNPFVLFSVYDFKPAFLKIFH